MLAREAAAEVMTAAVGARRGEVEEKEELRNHL